MSGWLRTGLWTYGALWLVTLVGAVVGRLAGGAAGSLGGAPRGGSGLFADVLATNGRLIAALAVAAALVWLVPGWRPVLDATVGGLVALNVLAVGAAAGAAGPALLRSLVHVPLEWAAVAAGLVPYLAARRRAISRRAAVGMAAVAALLLVLAAGVEASAPTIS